MELGDTSVELVMSDSIQDKFNKLNIEAELQVSLLAGLVKLNGSGAYFNEEKKSARAQSMSLVYKIRTINEEFMLRQNRDKIDLEILKAGEDLLATHVVVGIDWGAVCSITCQSENSDGKDESTVKGALGVHLEKLKAIVNVEGSAKVDIKDIQKEKLENFTFKCKSDVSTTDKDLPTTFEGALELAKNLPKIVKQTNKGKGVPILYMLMPLEAVTKIFRLPITLELHFSSVQEDSIKRVAQFMESVISKRQKLFDVQKDLHTFEEFVAESSLSDIDKYMDSITLDESTFKHKLQELVKKVRRQEADVSSLDQFVSESSGESSLFAKYDEHIRQFQGDLNRVNTIKAWKRRGIIYLGKRDQFTVDDADVMYILYKPNSNTDRKNEEFFLRYQKIYSQKQGTMFKVIDENIRPDLWGKRKNKEIIEEYKNGLKTCDNFYEKEGKLTQMCLVKQGKPGTCNCRPIKRANVKIMCPNSVSGTKECSSGPITWHCSKCKELIEYGLTTSLFYCQCGESKPTESLFRCNESSHGVDFISYPEELLREKLSVLREIQEMNILILGETGVGKSTWINGIVNYLSFADLNEAREADNLLVLIPSQFLFTKDGKSVEVKIGEISENEVLQPGHSATQETRSYLFHVGDLKIRLIDTPGIGDSRGIEQDRKNFDNILSYLNHYDEIHAVCILLKPNNSRLNAMFRFCIQELLVRLHTSAKNNIVFCFTNSRGTFYQPGDTLPSLNKMLKEKRIGITANPKNYFCFDNEAFRFLACLHNEITFSDEDVKIYAASWEKAVNETNKLFGHIKKIPPHETKKTISMNEARRVVVAMSKPMAAVAKTIQENVQEANNAMVEIKNDTLNMEALEEKLNITGVDLERKKLPYPMTVCTNSACTEIVAVGGDEIVNRKNFTQICHDHCNISGVPTETRNDPRLQGCKCISGIYCLKCRHHYNDHMHLTYTLEKVSKQFISKDVQKKILAKKTEKERKEEYQAFIDGMLNELQNEEKLIMQVSAKYGAFLKDNALIPYNDAVGDYLDLAIKEAKESPKISRDAELLERLKKLRSAYEKEKQILDEAMATGISTTSEQVIQLQNELFNLKHFGKSLKKIFDEISIDQSSRSLQFRETVALMPQRSVQDYSKKGPGVQTGEFKVLQWFSKKFNNLKSYWQ
ncbi:uncharacterized protein LOC114521398 [Dendronephthya gigantea]|uniref:uncharacterized protein LOC114521398 n=1 Tax=Dendronephthya gigantea TaxID=151771 RepID=UPI00106A2A4C|nr:uncharacterized protein LOC114521398 [Dendronephthya gigantea]